MVLIGGGGNSQSGPFYSSGGSFAKTYKTGGTEFIKKPGVYTFGLTYTNSNFAPQFFVSVSFTVN